MLRSRLFAPVALVALALALTGCSSGSGTPAAAVTLPADVVTGFTVPAAKDKGGSGNPVKIGVVGASNQQFLVLKDAALAEGIHLDIQDFTDYSQLNPALTSNQLDLNQFQHIAYLASYNVEKKQDLVPIGATAIYPLGLYSSKYTATGDIPAGATVAVPDDQTNQARGLQVLQSAGLIVLKAGTPSLFGQVADVDTAASKVKVTAIQADQTPRSLDDPNIAAAIINNDYIADTGISPADAITQDDAGSPAAAPFINVWVARNADKDLPLYAEIVRLAHSDAWNQALLDNSKGTGVLVDKAPAALQQVLADAEEQLRTT
ncbi:MAG: methionine ABC transporter substrate-binding protein [Propionibacteriaceae bacterium]|jgi:D-methionine transport system substrate-binding protein|nr:methionine ABC transporter substrate-binding protein [Propionibacteriaceae bacterium]